MGTFETSFYKCGVENKIIYKNGLYLISNLKRILNRSDKTLRLTVTIFVDTKKYKLKSILIFIKTFFLYKIIFLSDKKLFDKIKIELLAKIQMKFIGKTENNYRKLTNIKYIKYLLFSNFNILHIQIL